MIPDRLLESLGLDIPTRAGGRPSAQDAVFPVATVVAPLGLAGGRLVGPPEHRQTAGAAAQKTAQKIAVLGVVAERQGRVVRQLGLGLVPGGLVDERGPAPGWRSTAPWA